MTPNSDVEFGKNLVRLSGQSATGANRRFQLQKRGLTPSPNSNRRIMVQSFLAWRKRQCWNSKERGRSRDTNHTPKSEIRIRHQTSDCCAFSDDLADFESNMNIETLHIDIKVRHPRYGVTFVRLPLHRPNGANGMSDIEGKVTRAGASERGQRTSFKIGCCNFCKGLFLKTGWRWVDRNTGMERMG